MLNKNRTQSKNSNKKFDSWVFVQNGLCTKWSLYEMIPDVSMYI